MKWDLGRERTSKDCLFDYLEKFIGLEILDEGSSDGWSDARLTNLLDLELLSKTVSVGSKFLLFLESERRARNAAYRCDH